MSNLLEDSRRILEVANFITHSNGPSANFFQFEDISIMGHVHVLPMDTIRTKWEEIQDEFLRYNATRFLKDPTKAWNLYTVLLSTETADEQVATKLFAIEEDFRGTRKIARAGVTSRKDLLEALAPILQLENILSVRLVDAKQRLLERLGTSNAALRMISTDADAESIAETLLRSE